MSGDEPAIDTEQLPLGRRAYLIEVGRADAGALHDLHLLADGAQPARRRRVDVDLLWGWKP
jgi:hypothetical protein